MEGLDLINQISDSKVRHLVGFLPIVSFVLIFGYSFFWRIFFLGLFIILSAFFEFNWKVFNKNIIKTKETQKAYTKIESEKKLSEKEQLDFFKKGFDFINIYFFFLTMLFVSLSFIINMILTFSNFIIFLEIKLGILSGIYLFTFVYVITLIIYDKIYGGKER